MSARSASLWCTLAQWLLAALTGLTLVLAPAAILAQNAAEAPADGSETQDTEADETAEDGEEETAAGEESAAGNVADTTAGAEPTDAEPAGTAPPAESAEEAVGLSAEDLSELLGGFGDEEPGFIPDLEPSDLLMEPAAEAPGFFSLLGSSRLPRGEVEGIISLHEQLPDDELPENFARIVVPPSGTIQGSTETKQFHIEGGLTLYYSDVTIHGDSADIDEKNEVAVISGDVTILDPEYTLKTDELRIYFEDKRFQALGFVQFKKAADPQASEPDLSLPKKDRLREYFAGQHFELYCKNLYYDWESKELTALESVRIKHPAFNGSLDRLDYNDETKEYEMSGGVVLDVTEYGWIFDNELVEPDDVPKVEALTDGNTKITCERVVYSEDAGIAEFYAPAGGEVAFVQPTRSVRANYIEVNDETKDFFAESAGTPVRYQQSEGEWLFAGGLIERDSVDEDLGDALGGEMEVEALTLAYNFDRKRLELRGQVRIVAGEKLLTAEEVIQDDTAKYFLMRGNVFIKPDNNSEVMAAQVYMDTENDVLTLIGLVDGELRSEDLPATEEGEDAAPGEGEIEIAEGVFRAPTRVRGNGENVAEGG